MTNINLNNLQQGDNYELLHIDIESLAINAENRSFIVLSCQDLQTAIEVNSYEASMLSFVMKEYHKNSHIQTIHQVLLRLCNFYNSKVEEITIESKVGDLIYCSVKFVDKNLNNYFTIVSLCDGIILSILSQIDLKIIRGVWDNMDYIDEEWDFENYINED